MFRLINHKLYHRRIGHIGLATNAQNLSPTTQLPDHADVVIIGGGSAGCNALYHLARCGINAVLLEKSKLTSGTTWHTAGLVWSIRGPSDVEMELLTVTRNVLNSLENETGMNPGWIKNGGLYVARSKERLNEYKRLVTASKAFRIEANLLSPREAKEHFPLLDENSIQGAVYSAEDGAVDPTMWINALIHSARSNGCQILEDCPVTNIHTKETVQGKRRICAVETPLGIVKTDIVLNAAGVWSKNMANMVNVDIPLTPMKHAYIVTEPMDRVQNFPNVRDPDGSIYLRMQGSSMAIGGYEQNPIILSSAPEQFSFGLYELDWDVFNVHVESMVRLVPKLATTGIRTTVCGPESFTPDHRPLMGEDPRCSGFFYSCGYNSAGMMLGSGCGEQIAHWIINGRPQKYMFNYDIRRFLPEQRSSLAWTIERSHEAYVKNYSIVFPHDQPLSGRNFKIDPFHSLLVERGAVMEEFQGWERAGWFSSTERVNILPYNYDRSCATAEPRDDQYRTILEKEYNFDLSPHDNIIREEAFSCLNNAALFNVSYLGKFYLCGPDAERAADHLCTANVNCEFNKTIDTCMLNHAGGVEADCTVTMLEPGSSGIVDPIFKGKAFYIVSRGTPALHTCSHINKVIEENDFNVSLHDVTDQMGILSVQGPNSRNIMEELAGEDLSDASFKYATTKLIKIKESLVRLFKISFVGDLGFELHVPRSSCQFVYKTLADHGKRYNMKLAGRRALQSLSCEKGYLLWGSDLRSDDNPVEADLGHICRSAGKYVGKAAVDRLKVNGVKKRLLRVHLNSAIPLWGLEVIYRNNRPLGYLRRIEQAYSSKSTIGHGYIRHPNGENVTKEFLQSGNYEVEVMGKRYAIVVCLRKIVGEHATMNNA